MPIGGKLLFYRKEKLTVSLSQEYYPPIQKEGVFFLFITAREKKKKNVLPTSIPLEPARETFLPIPWEKGSTPRCTRKG